MSKFKGPDIKKAYPNVDPNISVLKALVEALRKNGDSTAVVEGDTGRSVSSSCLLRQSLCIAAGLRGAGLAVQDHVVICCDKSILSISLLLGTMFTGATAVLAPTTHAGQLHSLTRVHRVKAVFYDEKYQDSVIQESIPLMDPSPPIVACINNADQTMTNILNSGCDFDVFEVSEVNSHIPLILFSSGTTGVPKGIKISHIGIRRPGMGFQPATTILSFAPLFWYSNLAQLSMSIFQRLTWVITNCSGVKYVLRLTQNYKVKVLYASASFMAECYQEPSLNSFDLSSLHTICYGGEVVHEHVLRTLSTTVFQGKVNLLSAYGTTETGVLTKCEKPSALDHSGSPLSGVELKIVDDEGWVVPVGHVGHIMCRCVTLTPGYYSGNNSSTLPLDHEGFFRIGDVGFVDNNERLHLRGRAVDFIIYRDVKVSPWEIEDVLVTHPGVANAAVVGRPHPTDGQRPVAFVVRRADSDVTEDQLVTFVGGKVDDAKRLTGGVIFTDEIPMSINTGKVQRNVLMERVMKG